MFSPSLRAALNDFAKQFLFGFGQFGPVRLAQEWPGSTFRGPSIVLRIGTGRVGENQLAIARLSGAGKCDALNKPLEIGKIHADRRALGKNESGRKTGRAGAPARASGRDLGGTGILVGAAESDARVRGAFKVVLPAVFRPAADGGLAAFAG